MRLALAVVLALALPGCVFGHGEHQATPCKPAGAATFGTLAVHVPRADGENAQDPAGHCVGLKKLGEGERYLATARIGPDGNATLALPAEGELYITWTEPWPHDKACATHGYAFVTVPGPGNVTLDVGGVCY